MKTGRIYRPETEPTRLALPRVGFIKVGRKSDKGLPQSVDYFIPTGNYARLFTAAYGEKPQSIQIVFPDDDPTKVCAERYEYRDDDGRLIGSGDGKTFEIWDGKNYRTMTVAEYPNLMKSIEQRYPNRAVKKGEEGWDITLTMNFVIPCVQGVAGVWQFISKGSASTIPQIRETFDGIAYARGGKVSGIIFDMNVAFATSNKPGDKSRYPVVSIVPNQSAENIQKIREAMTMDSVPGLFITKTAGE